MPKTEIAWQQFWERVWVNLFHTLALVCVVGGFVWLGWWLFFGPTSPPSSPSARVETARVEYVQISTTEQAALQNVFNALITTDKRPCGLKRKGEKLTDVRGCSLFRLRLGMTVDEVNRALEQSGYFPSKAVLINQCKPEKEKTCVHTHFIFRQRDGFSVTADFSPQETDDKSLTLKQITLWFGPGSNPYFEPENVRSTFVKVVGPPDETINNNDNWGGYSGTFLSAFISERRYHISLQQK